MDAAIWPNSRINQTFYTANTAGSINHNTAGYTLSIIVELLHAPQEQHALRRVC